MSDKVESGSGAQKSYQWRRWKVVAIVFAAVLLGLGGIFTLAGGGEKREPPRPRGVPEEFRPEARAWFPVVGPGSCQGGTPSSGGQAEAAPETTDGMWSPALMKGGLSFFVGLAVAFALRTFFKIALFFIGIWAGSLLLLSSLGWIEIHWPVIDTAFNGLTSRLGEQFESFKTFLTGSLPSAGMAGLGLFTGLRKR